MPLQITSAYDYYRNHKLHISQEAIATQVVTSIEREKAQYTAPPQIHTTVLI